MPLPLPNLDDRRFSDLIAEARALLPSLDPSWTNYNASDPGVTLIELFAWLTEILIYRVDLITNDSRQAFLRLLNGPDWRPSGDLQFDIRQSILALRECDRAVTPDDFIRLTLRASDRIARAACVPGIDIAAMAGPAPADGTVSVVLLTSDAAGADAALLAQVGAFLEPRRMLGCRVRTASASLVKVKVALTVQLKTDARPDRVKAAAAAAVDQWFHPLTGGPEGAGWPFGRGLFISDVYDVLAATPGVDFVEPIKGLDEITIGVDGRRLVDVSGAFAGVQLKPWEIPAPGVDLAGSRFIVPVTP